MTRFEQLLSKEGQQVTWHKRQEGSADSETGDLAVTWTTEQIKAVVQRVSIGEVIVEAGYTSEDYIRIFTISGIQQKDKITYQNVEYEILPPESILFRGTVEYRTALCRRLIT